MAVVSGTITAVHGYTTVIGQRTDSSNNLIYNCYVSATFSGTYAQSDNAIVSAVPTAIKNAMQVESTVTLLDAAFAQRGNEAGTAIGAKTVAVSTADITLELTGADMSTEHASAALGTMSEPINFFVSYKITNP